jgi:hypothetical protein
MAKKKTNINKSPFPGMDPYLEGDLWQEFHETLANQIRAQLMTVLPSEYVALLKRYYLIDRSGVGIVDMPSKQVIYPDTHVTTVKEEAVTYDAVTAPSIELVSPLPESIPVLRVEIRDVAQRRLVTTIEILSPANKRGSGFQEYAEKRMALLQTSTHLLELDLLRAGERIRLIGGELPSAPYYVFLSRFTRRPRTEVWSIQLREPLPTVPVPLLPPDADVPLALQAVIEACFELVGYQRLLDYSQPPPAPPLEPEDLEWVAALLKPYRDGA